MTFLQRHVAYSFFHSVFHHFVVLEALKQLEESVFVKDTVVKKTTIVIVLVATPLAQQSVLLEASSIDHLHRTPIANNELQRSFSVLDIADFLCPEAVFPVLEENRFSLLIHGKSTDILPVFLSP